MISRPDPPEHLPYFSRYVGQAPDGDPVAFLAAQRDVFLDELEAFAPERTLQGYAEGKWSLRETLQHLSDTERIFSYRLLRIARGDQQALPGFEQDDYVKSGRANHIDWSSLIAEFASVRQATLTLIGNLPEAAFLNIGTANGHPMSARALVYILAGHVEHHRALIRKHYA